MEKGFLGNVEMYYDSSFFTNQMIQEFFYSKMICNQLKSIDGGMVCFVSSELKESLIQFIVQKSIEGNHFN